MITKIKKPLKHRCLSLIGGEVVSYDPELKQVAVGYDAAMVSSEAMAQILAEDDIEGRRTSLILRAVNAAAAEPDF